jgi:hypothetical protein
MFEVLLDKYYSLPLKYRKLASYYALALLALGMYGITAKIFNDNILNNILDKCFIPTPKGMKSFINVGRGSNYYLNNKYATIPTKCLLTGWALAHIILYAIIGFNLPDMFWESLFIGILFEIIECTAYKAHDVLDVLWNTLGFFIGYLLNKIYNKAFNKE